VSVNGVGLGMRWQGRSGKMPRQSGWGLIAMKAFGPAGRASGVAYLRATPFAAGQALAARRQPRAIGRDSCIARTGAQPEANLGRDWPSVGGVSCAAVIRRQGS